MGTTEPSTLLSALDGWTSWSERTSPGRYELVVRDPDGNPHVGASRRATFDVDLGLGSAGGAVATYSRCQREARRRTAGTFYTEAEGCRIVEWDAKSGRSRTILRDGQSQVLPTRWRQQVAYIRTDQKNRTRLVLAQRRSGRWSRTVMSLPPGLERGAGPLKLDLRAGRAILTWARWTSNPCPHSEPGDVDSLVTEVYEYNRGRRHRVAAGCLSDGETEQATQITSVGFASPVAGGTVWMQIEASQHGITALRVLRSVAGGALERTPLPSGTLAAGFARDGGVLSDERGDVNVLAS